MIRPALLTFSTTVALVTAACADGTLALDAGPVAPSGQKHFACAVHARKSTDDLASPAWNQLTRDLVAKYRTDPSARPYALVGLAEYVAVARAQDRPARLCPSSRAAVAGATAVVLTYLYPGETAALEALVAAQRSTDAAAALADADELAAGEEIGREAGTLVVTWARGDGSDVPWTGTVPTGPGLWFSSANPPAPPATPILAQTRAWFLESNSQFRPAPPPEFGSNEYKDALAEVKSVQDARTAAQLEIAKKWALSGGTYRLQGYWNAATAELAVQYGLREREATHALALVGMAMHDASVACFDAKYTYWFIRPSQADPTIVPAISLSNHPSYPSSHSCTAGAASTVLAALFPGDAARLGATADEIAMSRLYGGIHYRFDNDTGLTIGTQVGALALATGLVGWVETPQSNGVSR